MKNYSFDNVLYPFTDERVFPIIMQDPKICKKFLERLFPERKVNDIRLREELPDFSRVTTEKTLYPNVKGHGVRFDVLFEDEDAWYDIEMQVRSRKDLPKRTRYYHALMDCAFLKKGHRYNSLNPQYVIFICAYDPFRKGLPVYKFSMREEKSNLSLGDESYTIILNTCANKKKIPAELMPLYMYINQNSVDTGDELVREIHEQVIELNSDSDWRDALMTWEEMLEEKLEEGYEDGFEKGKTDGFQEGMHEGIQQGVQQGIQEGIQQGKNELLAKLVGDEQLQLAAALNMSDDPDELKILLNSYDRLYPDYY